MPTNAPLLICEYEHLKQEQRLRIATRDNLVCASVAAMVAVGGAALEAHSPALLLLWPPLALVLGLNFVANDQKVSAIRAHITSVIAPQLTRIVDGEVLTWETVHRTGRGARSRKVGQLAANLLVFCLPALLAPLGYTLSDGGTALLDALAAVELAGVAALVAQIVGYSEVRQVGDRT
ncbi:hypothetical protein Lfu02_64590 [Longispora fulva]|uniref:Uncharacterized protein n=1 Tax=Longispora fulva TaxID=619741 RepID=A0A8J7GGY0_9ACTN|nr:hypothetical protein [Longispora fulva]MBG6137756.1 hypothetical protein [Longispora fulva]GIG62087.1 hypothetical protein Lfu02_64590 [Longispora fulva]